MPSDTQTSKFISLLLRHDPGAAGLTLDRHGWVAIAELCAAVTAAGHPLDATRLLALASRTDKQRWELSPDGTQVRALHGHSVELEFDYQPAAPPAVLYHGTVGRFLESIRAQGLLPGDRQFVHLSETTAVAAEVARRRGKPVVLTVAAARMAADGRAFYRTAAGIWLTAEVPAVYLVE